MKKVLLTALLALSSAGFANDAANEVMREMEGTVKIGESFELPYADGDTKYCVVTFSNRSGMDIPYKFHWQKPNGEKRGKYKDRVLEKGYCKWHSYDCTNMTEIYFERFMLKYSFTPESGKQFKTYKLVSGQSQHQTCEDGPQWTFRKRKGSSKKIDLKQTRQ